MQKIGRYTYISMTVTVNGKVFHSEGDHRTGLKAQADSLRYLLTLPPGALATVCTDTTLMDRDILRAANGTIIHVPIAGSTRTTHVCWPQDH